MNRYPLIRKIGSNETVMSHLFAVSLLYLIPEWISKPESIFHFLLILLTGLLIDAFINFLRYKRPVCSVSAAVTASLLQILTPSVPLWGQLCALAVALILGKHVFGGTGKNIFNHAVFGSFFLVYFFKIDLPILSFSFWTIIAMLLSIPFLGSRPFASLGYLLGIIISLSLRGDLTFETLITYGIFFWGTLIITDPVTITFRPVSGFMIGILMGALSLQFQPNLLFLTGGILAFNLISFIVDRLPGFPDLHFPSKLKIKPPIPINCIQNDIIDLSHRKESDVRLPKHSNSSEILSLINRCEVFGHGGGAFPTSVKIETVLNSKATEKYFIINGMECDPGLIHDKILLQKYPEKISEGISLISEIVPFNKIVLAVKNDFSPFNFPQNVNIIKLPSYYPAGSEKELVKQILKQQLPSDSVPAKHGILVLNVQTIIAVASAVTENIKADTKVITVANLKHKQSKAVRVNIGDSILEIVQKIFPGGYPVFYGGGIMLSEQADEDSDVDKKTSFIAVSDFVQYKESPQCSHCGKCVQYCPEKLDVRRIAEAVDKGKYNLIKHIKPQKCVNCGICSYVCPAGRNLMKKVKEAVDNPDYERELIVDSSNLK